MRLRVTKRQIGRWKGSPLVILRITYDDGRRTWGLSAAFGLTLFGSDHGWMNRYIKSLAE